MTDESMSYLEALKEIKRLKEVLEQKPCEDAVSRQDALNCVTFNEFRYRIVEDIKALPSVTPKEKSEYEHDHEVVKAYNDGQAFILDKIRAEIKKESEIKTLQLHWGEAMGLNKAIDIIDKYRGE